MPTLLRSARKALGFCLVLATLVPSCHAQDAIWGLFYNNYFSVETTIDRTTTITVGQGQPIVSSSREVIVVSYRVRRLRPTDVTLDARIIECRRGPLPKKGDENPATTSTEEDNRATLNLKNLEFEVRINRDGGISSIRIPAEMTRQLDEGVTSAQSILKSTVTEATIASWLSRPFWLTVEDEDFAAETEWQQIDEVSLGLMGQLRTLVTFQIDDVSEQTASVTIAGKSRHITPARLSRSEAVLAFRDVTMESTEFQGNATMVRRGEAIDERTQQPRQRPWLENMKLEWNVKGSAVASINNSNKEVSFEQQRTETSRILADYYVGDQPLFRAPRELQIPR